MSSKLINTYAHARVCVCVLALVARCFCGQSFRGLIVEWSLLPQSWTQSSSNSTCAPTITITDTNFHALSLDEEALVFMWATVGPTSVPFPELLTQPTYGYGFTAMGSWPVVVGLQADHRHKHAHKCWMLKYWPMLQPQRARGSIC